MRLSFRNLPPYMVRKLGKDQSNDETPIEPLVQYLKVTQMASREITLR